MFKEGGIVDSVEPEKASRFLRKFGYRYSCRRIDFENSRYALNYAVFIPELY